MRNTHLRTAHLPLITCLLLLAVTGCSNGADSSPTEKTDAGPVALRRLTAEQFSRSIRDVLGDHITVPSRIDPDDRRDGLLAVGATFAGVTPSGFEKYEAAANAVAEQALDTEHRADLVHCQPASATTGDEECATAFIERVGRRLLRRSLTGEELDARVAIASEAANALGDFYAGLEIALASILVSPDFLFRIEEAEPDPSDPSTMRLTSVAMASRLSYLLWNTTPDDDLIAAGESGDLVDDDRLAEQVERLLSSPKLEIGIRSIFSDLYEIRGELDLLSSLSERFAESAYSVRELMRELVLSDGFRTTSGPRVAEEAGDES